MTDRIVIVMKRIGISLSVLMVIYLKSEYPFLVKTLMVKAKFVPGFKGPLQ